MMGDNDRSTNGNSELPSLPGGVERDDSDRHLHIPNDLAANDGSSSARTTAVPSSKKTSDLSPPSKQDRSQTSSTNSSDLFKDLGISSPQFNQMSINISSNVNQLLNLKSAFDKKSSVETVKNTGRFLEAGLAGPLLTLIARYTGNDEHYFPSNSITGGGVGGSVSSPAVCQWGCRALTNLAKNKVCNPP